MDNMNTIRDGRARTGVVASAVGVGVNLALALSKIITGALCGLLSVIADGVNNLSDCSASAVTLVAFAVYKKPADKEHPYGHRRAEHIASLIVGMIILFLAVELAVNSVKKIIGGGGAAGMPTAVVCVLALSLAVKAGLGAYFLAEGKKIGSSSLKAAGIDSFSDCFATAAVLAGLFVSAANKNFPADGWAGAVVALFVLLQGVRVVKDACSQLLGRAPEEGLTDKLADYLRSGESVLGVHDLRVYGYGKDMYFATAHVEMDCSVPPMQAHSVVDGLERGAGEKFGVDLCVHLDPVDLSDGEAIALGKAVAAALSDVCEGFEIHDFRMVRGAKIKLVFDAGVPYSCKSGDDKLRFEIEKRIAALGDFALSVRIERE